ncbi:hypothetical protein ACHAW6_012645 [Cyclotella cf. meneghiniana]
MSMTLPDVILMELIKKMRECNFDIINMQLYVYCKGFVDNSGTLELARHPRLLYVITISGTCAESLNQNLSCEHKRSDS